MISARRAARQQSAAVSGLIARAAAASP